MLVMLVIMERGAVVHLRQVKLALLALVRPARRVI